MKLAIIGAGISGLSLAHALESKFSVTIFEKARGASGRLATRYQDDFAFDHGVAHYTVRDARFKAFISPYVEQGSIAKWQPTIATFDGDVLQSESKCSEPLYVNSPKMNQLCKDLAATLDVRTQTRVEHIEKSGNTWLLKDDAGNELGEFDWGVSSAPSVQTAELFADLPSFSQSLADTKMTGCFSLMLGFSELILPSWHIAKIQNSPIAKITIEHSKPNRKQGVSVLVQSDNEWADAMIEEESERVKAILMQELQSIIPFDEANIAYQNMHRWRYANVARSANQPFLIDADSQLAACGDWCIEGRVEAAFLSGFELAEALNDH